MGGREAFPPFAGKRVRGLAGEDRARGSGTGAVLRRALCRQPRGSSRRKQIRPRARLVRPIRLERGEAFRKDTGNCPRLCSCPVSPFQSACGRPLRASSPTLSRFGCSSACPRLSVNSCALASARALERDHCRALPVWCGTPSLPRFEVLATGTRLLLVGQSSCARSAFHWCFSLAFLPRH